ncbi:MAG: hypothetical protein KKA36_02200, partial [Gammaproteobacteria bacterium]|nr:hypothetical protein [Gammaproteobacteria bacterium]
MIRLTKVTQAWGQPDFEVVLKTALEGLDVHHLPLQQGLSAGSYALDKDVRVMFIGAEEGVNTLQIKVGVFYTSIIAGCNCADDPTPVDELSEYCELLLEIDK